MKKLTAFLMLLVLSCAFSVSAQDTLEPTATVGAIPGTLDPTAPPNYGGITLEAGFLPDPWLVSVVSGGDVDASQAGLGEGCFGYMTGAPDFVLTYSGTSLSGNLRILYVGSADTTLVVAEPNGGYFCNDNSETSDPLIDFPTPAAGAYAIWVGSVNSSTPAHGYLMITEVQSAPGAILTDVQGFVTAFTPLTGAPAEATIEAEPQVTEEGG